MPILMVIYDRTDSLMSENPWA